MKYENIKKGIFISRPNRFIANIKLDGKTEVCHVKNTGRCKELLTDNAVVYVCKSNNSKRKTKYDLITVRKGDRLINMDSQIPNKVFAQWINEGGLLKNVTYIRAEKTFGSSRLDYYIEADGDKIFAEIKGVTLEENGIAKFPDAPTQRGVKHILELINAAAAGYKAYAVFVIQTDNIKYFTPNYKTHKAFGEALKKAQEKGVNLIALECTVTESTINPKGIVPIVL